MDYTLLLSGSSFTVGEAEPELGHNMAAATEPAHKMAATPESHQTAVILPAHFTPADSTGFSTETVPVCQSVQSHDLRRGSSSTMLGSKVLDSPLLSVRSALKHHAAAARQESQHAAAAARQESQHAAAAARQESQHAAAARQESQHAAAAARQESQHAAAAARQESQHAAAAARQESQHAAAAA
ncbi:MAG: hypothetical protein ACRC38_03840, partial [Plesiomonas sp.]